MTDLGNVARQILATGRDEDVALIHQGVITTYGELRHRVDQLAGAMTQQGSRKGDRVALFANNGDFFVIGYLATLQAGLCSVPLLTNLRPETLRSILEISAPSLVLCEASLEARLRSAMPDRSIGVWRSDSLPETNSTPRFPTVDAETDLAAIIFTSGSTGTPKGVMVSHRNIAVNTRDIVSYLGLTRGDRAMVVLPFAYCYGASILHTHLSVGASVVIDNGFMFAEKVLDRMVESECTGFAGVPSTYQILLRRTRFAQRTFPRLRWLQQAGGKLAEGLIHEIRAAHPAVKLFVMYGQTEATARLSYLPPEHLDTKLGSIGRGLPSTTLEVLKPDGEPVTPGSDEIGEIVASGENIALGYWGDRDETQQNFRDGKLRTGDLARIDADGFIFIEGRARHFIKCMGYRISPREIEDVLASHPEVVEAAVLGERDDLMGERIKALVVLSPAAEVDTALLQKHCLLHLPNYMVPSVIEFVDDLPKTATGKLDRNAL